LDKNGNNLGGQELVGADGSEHAGHGHSHDHGANNINTDEVAQAFKDG
jgi:hypothetical protein